MGLFLLMDVMAYVLACTYRAIRGYERLPRGAVFKMSVGEMFVNDGIQRYQARVTGDRSHLPDDVWHKPIGGRVLVASAGLILVFVLAPQLLSKL
jgi:hypothetical protein